MRRSAQSRSLLFLCLAICVTAAGEATTYEGYFTGPLGCVHAEATAPPDRTPVYFGPYPGLTSVVPFVWNRSCDGVAEPYASASGDFHAEMELFRLIHFGTFSFTLQDNAYFAGLTWVAAVTRQQDHLTVTGGSGQGWLRLRFSYTAAASSSSPDTPFTDLTVYVAGLSPSPFAIQRTPGTLEVEIPFTYGELLDVRWDISSVLQFPELSMQFGASGSGQFSAAATLVSAQVLGEDGAEVPGAQVLSSASVPYPVPEPPACRAGGEDSDGDGLCDAWEAVGLTVEVAGAQVFLDLPRMGADPRHKDVFVQTDYMVGSGHSHQPHPEAIARTVQAFAEAPVHNPDGIDGITLHVDCGPGCIMNPKTGEPWGALSAAHVLEHVSPLGALSAGGYDWTAFDQLKSASLPPARAPVFHYAVFAHDLGGLGSTSGLSRSSPASDLLVSLGAWSGQTGTVLQQQGTFVHELGHNLSLRHGGFEDVHNKPNYLSVMNYLFQTSGLARDGLEGVLDYSRYGRYTRLRLPDLGEDLLDERIGLSGGAPVSALGTRHYCPGNSTRPERVADAGGPIDWNCDGAFEAGVSADVNADGSSHGILSAFDDWAHLVYDGGSIGALGAAAGLPAVTPAVEELTQPVDANIPRSFSVAVVGPGILDVAPGTAVDLAFTVTNHGDQDDTYEISAGSNVDWADLATLPSSLALAAGASAQVTLPVRVPPPDGVAGEGRFAVKATSTGSPLILDRAEAVLYPAARADLSVAMTGPASAPAGSQVVYTISVLNSGPEVAHAVRVLDPSPSGGLTFLANSGDCTTAFPCALGSLAVGQTKTFQSRFVIPAAYGGPNPLTNTATVGSTGNTTDGNPANNSSSVSTTVIPVSPASPGSFFTVTPCRAVDTRRAQGPRGGPTLAAGAERTFTLAGACGVPPGATAVAGNVTVTGPTAAGHLRLYPGGTAPPPVSTINYMPGQTRANNGVIPLGPTGDVTVLCNQGSGATHFVMDVTGYFE